MTRVEGGRDRVSSCPGNSRQAVKAALREGPAPQGDGQTLASAALLQWGPAGTLGQVVKRRSFPIPESLLRVDGGSSQLSKFSVLEVS